MWQYDVDADSVLEDSERLYVCYDGPADGWNGWRAATYWDDGDPKEQFVHHAAGQRGFGGSSYIDSVILRDRDDTSGWASSSDGVLEERVYHIQNWRADVVAIIASDAELLEYVRYSSYGVATSYPKGDYDLDGDVDSADTTALGNFIAGAGGWNLDFNRDGNTDGDDVTEHTTYRTGYTGGTGGRGVLSRSALRNRMGYAGYHFDDTLSAYHVRHRVYFPEIGRWSRRDPAGYVDGMGLYNYVRLSPVNTHDSLGLVTSCAQCESDVTTCLGHNSIVIQRIKELTKAGCAYTFSCRNDKECSAPGKYGYTQKDKVSICCSRMTTGMVTCETLAHELYHVLQNCQNPGGDGNDHGSGQNLGQWICEERDAIFFSGSCCTFGHWRRAGYPPRTTPYKSFEECIQDMTKTSSCPACPSDEFEHKYRDCPSHPNPASVCGANQV